jgi:DNA-binding transcriptional regulator YhcF (GntR family)
VPICNPAKALQYQVNRRFGENPMTPAAVGQAEVAQLKVNEKKWTPTLMKAGWTVLPNVLFERQQALGLDAIDINIILHIASYWWTKEGKPHPSKKTIATAMGIEPRTVQRRIAQLEAAQLIRRQERRSIGNVSQTNVYHLDGLIAAATPYALEKIQEREAKAAEKAARAARKGKPKLTVVKSEDD